MNIKTTNWRRHSSCVFWSCQHTILVDGSSRPHAVTSAGGTSYSYDANGSLISDGSGRSMTYTAANQLGSATKAGDATSFEYDGNRNRFRRVDVSGAQTTSTLYVGGVEIITLPTGIVETKRYVGDAVLTTRSNATSQEAYVLRDHLGSLNLIVDQNSQVEILQSPLRRSIAHQS